MNSRPALGPHTIVSIVVPAYNHGRYVAETIESVLAQDHPHIELIVIDDGSTDETAAVLKRFVGVARILQQANAGQSATINRGWKEARGEVLSYLSADDRLEPGAVSRALATLADHPGAVLAYGDFDLIDPDSKFVRHVPAPAFDYTAMVRDLVCAPGPGVFLLRSAVEQIEGWRAEFRQGPDFEYWLRLSLLGPFVRVPQVLASLRVHPGSTSYGMTTPERAEEFVRIMESYFARTDLPPSTRALERRSLSSAHVVAARAHFRAHRLQSGIHSLRRAASLSPATLFSLRSGRLLANALVNRTGHRLLWRLRRAWSRPED